MGFTAIRAIAKAYSGSNSESSRRSRSQAELQPLSFQPGGNSYESTTVYDITEARPGRNPHRPARHTSLAPPSELIEPRGSRQVSEIRPRRPSEHLLLPSEQNSSRRPRFTLEDDDAHVLIAPRSETRSQSQAPTRRLLLPSDQTSSLKLKQKEDDSYALAAPRSRTQSQPRPSSDRLLLPSEVSRRPKLKQKEDDVYVTVAPGSVPQLSLELDPANGRKSSRGPSGKLLLPSELESSRSRLKYEDNDTYVAVGPRPRSQSRPGRRGVDSALAELSLDEVSISRRDPSRGRNRTAKFQQYVLPTNKYGLVEAGPSLTIQRAEPPRSSFRTIRHHGSSSDLPNLVRYLPEGIPRNDSGLEEADLRSRSRPRRHPGHAHSDTASEYSNAPLIVEETDWREAHRNFPHSHLRQAKIHTPYRTATDAEMHRILEKEARREREIWEQQTSNFTGKKRTKYVNHHGVTGPVIGLQVSDDQGWMSSTTRGTVQAVPARAEDDARFHKSQGLQRHQSWGRCTEHGNRDQAYLDMGLTDLDPDTRLEALRDAGFRTTTIDAQTLVPKPGCYSTQYSHCNLENDYYGAEDVASSRRSGRDTEIWYKAITQAEMDQHLVNFNANRRHR